MHYTFSACSGKGTISPFLRRRKSKLAGIYLIKVVQGKGLNQDSNPGLCLQSLCFAISKGELVPEKKLFKGIHLTSTIVREGKRKKEREREGGRERDLSGTLCLKNIKLSYENKCFIVNKFCYNPNHALNLSRNKK